MVGTSILLSLGVAGTGIVQISPSQGSKLLLIQLGHHWQMMEVIGFCHPSGRAGLELLAADFTLVQA